MSDGDSSLPGNPAPPTSPAPDRSDPDPAAGPPAPIRRSRGRTVPVLVAALLVASAVAGGTAVWAVDRTGTLPEDVLPGADMAVFARVDPRPGLSEAATARRFAASYREAAAGNGPAGDGVLGWVLSPLLAGSGLTVADDVAPWAGERIGVVQRREGTVIVAVEVNGDHDAVDRFLTDLERETGVAVGHTFTRGYVLLSDDPRTAEAAAVAAATGSAVSDDDGFRSDLESLPGSRLAVLVADLSPADRPGPGRTFSRLVADTALDSAVGAQRLLSDAVPDDSPLVPAWREVAAADLGGRLVLGAAWRPDGLALEGFVRDLSIGGTPVEPTAAPPDPLAEPVAEATTTSATGPTGAFQVRALPGDTALAVGVRGLDGVLATLTGDVPADPAGGGSQVQASSGSSPSADPPDPPDPPDATATPDPAPSATSPVAELRAVAGTDTAVGVLAGGGVVGRAAGTDPEALAEVVTRAGGGQPLALASEGVSPGPVVGVVGTGESRTTTPLDNLPGFAAWSSPDDARALLHVDLSWLADLGIAGLAPFRTAGLTVGDVEPGATLRITGGLTLAPAGGATVPTDPSSPATAPSGSATDPVGSSTTPSPGPAASSTPSSPTVG
jgi:hypothetical protein